MDAATIFFLFLAGLVSAGQLWPTAMRRSIFSIGSRDDETLDLTQSEDSLLRRNSCDHRDAFASLQDQLRSLESEVQDLSDAIKEMHVDVWRVLEK
jgi:septal ring factor EnvC (AmiA/AmiB activator)